ncbi:hypothetical protein [Jannaschia rubra]|uniref:Uncharacterized protein n=1 Tax=Jannaschia rubra TaxID=282197 RepID=A0A0M6XUN5_9RHOB|nr:hypothetical protein [Jannaschia rubra]CTQ33925.1 hypothetical protein JAN5088_02714 [Jannaschia rubra]SFG76332.1 hypothetical protein SAMN04488517_11427 [Jannaschia rubra]
MNYDTTEMRATLRAAATRRAFADWLRADSDRLISAAELLGGDGWEGRAAEVAAAMADGAEPEDVEADLVALHRLLTLECMNDIESAEAVRFLAVHPDDPRADDARLCAEALERGLDALRELAAMAVQEVA